jgi:hypothetical protein
MAVAPFQCWLDLPAISSASRTSNVVTLTFVAAHGVVADSVIQVADITGSSGTTMNGVYSVATVPTSTTLTYASTGTNGSGTVTSTSNPSTKYTAVASIDLFNPLVNYATANRQGALYVPTETVRMSAVGDGSGSMFDFDVQQDVTPAAGPWFSNTPDEARMRLYYLDTYASPTTASLMFIGVLQSIDIELNGSRLGTKATLQFTDLSPMLERVVVPGNKATKVEISCDNDANTVSISRVSNLVTVDTSASHLFAVGSSVTISNVLGGAGTSFNGTYTVKTVPTTTQFTYDQSGTDATGVFRRGVANTATGIVRAGTTSNPSPNKIRVTTANPHGVISGQAIDLTGYANTAAPGGGFENRLNSTYSGTAVKTISSTVLELTLDGNPSDWHGMTATSKGNSDLSNAWIQRASGIVPVATPQSGDNQMTIGIPGSASEDTAAQNLMSAALRYHSGDAVLKRLIDLSDTSKIAGGSKTNTIGVSFPAASLRSALDSVIEAYSGQDGKLRRYWVDNLGRVNYKLIDSLSAPASADAPYKIVSTSTQNPDTTTAQATVAATEVKATWNFQTVKQVLVTSSTDNATNPTSTSKMIRYTESGYGVRPLAPILDEILDAPTKTANVDAENSRLAKAFFIDRYKSVLSATFVLVGSGTQTWNKYGFIGGYRSSGNLVRSWQPGQWADVEIPAMGLSGKYRIERVELEMLPGTYDCVVRITINRKPQSNLVALLNNKGTS